LNKEAKPAEALMNVLISKMEAMDGDINILKQENNRLRHIVSNPNTLMKQMGLVPVSTPFSEDVMPDGFRPTEGDAILKGPDELGLPIDNAEFHKTSWDDIHEMADSARAAGNVEEPFKVITGRDNE
jgi:hypothetical protein